MTYGEYKQTKEYKNAKDSYICVNGSEPLDEMYFPDDYDNCLVVGCEYMADGTIGIDIITQEDIEIY